MSRLKSKMISATVICLSAGAFATAQWLYYLRNFKLHKLVEFDMFFRDTLRAGLTAFFLLLILLAWLMSRRQPAQNISSKLPCLWLASFLLVLFGTLTTVLMVDPHGHFATGLFSSPILLVTRPLKAKLYLALPATPDMVILGSSRAFTLSPAYLEEQLNITAFNASVESGKTEDYLIWTRFLTAGSKQDFPKILLIEISQPLDAGAESVAETLPLRLIPYMRPRVAMATLIENANDLITQQALADSVYALREISFGNKDLMPIVVYPDGSATMKGTENLDVFLKMDIGDRQGAGYCNQLDAGGVQNVEQISKLAREHDIVVLFYISPLHPDFYVALMRDKPKYQTCHRLMLDAMNRLTAQYDNVFFIDLIQLDSLNARANEGFRDSDHLNPLGAQLVIDALTPMIRDALRWTSLHSVQP